MEDYEKKYKEAILRAKAILKVAANEKEAMNYVSTIFPELKESEDEKIRKRVLFSLQKDFMATKNSGCSTKDLEDCIAWLEKQGESDETKAKTFLINKGYPIDTNGTFPTYMEMYNIIKDGFEKQGINYSLVEEIKKRKDFFMREKEKAVSSNDKLSLGARIAMLEELLVFVKEKQGEQKPVVDFKAKDWYVSKVDGQIHDMTYNPANKIKSKFKVGDWIIFNGFILHIDEVVDGYYKTTTFDGIPNSYDWDIDNVARLWVIQDAKDGDVLISQYGKPFIYNGNYNSLNIGAYCGITCDDNFKVAEEKCHWTENVDIKPSIKEQRDLLFTKMEEAGYQWDAEKKELKKIEEDGVENKKQIMSKMFDLMTVYVKQKSESAWSDEDEKMYRMCIDAVEYYHTPEDESAIREWLRSLKNRIQPQAKEWSEEDELIVSSIEGALEGYEGMVSEDWEKEKKWLKSLKDKITWKPNKEQMETLEYYMHTLLATEHKEVLFGLYNDLKKL